MTDERLPTPDLLAGDCVHSRMVSRVGADSVTDTLDSLRAERDEACG